MTPPTIHAITNTGGNLMTQIVNYGAETVIVYVSRPRLLLDSHRTFRPECSDVCRMYIYME